MLDAKDLINDVLLQESTEQLFTFFDPPYYKQGQALYKNAFNHKDHVSLSETIKKNGQIQMDCHIRRMPRNQINLC